MTQSPTNPIHIGYSSLEDLIASSDDSPFYALPIETSRPSSLGASSGMTHKELSIRVSQVRGDGVHHCEIRLAELLYMGSRPMDEERAQHARTRLNAAWERVWDYLTQHTSDVHQAAVATPPDLTLVGGWADCLNELFTTTKRKE